MHTLCHSFWGRQVPLITTMQKRAYPASARQTQNSYPLCALAHVCARPLVNAQSLPGSLNPINSARAACSCPEEGGHHGHIRHGRTRRRRRRLHHTYSVAWQAFSQFHPATWENTVSGHSQSQARWQAGIPVSVINAASLSAPTTAASLRPVIVAPWTAASISAATVRSPVVVAATRAVVTAASSVASAVPPPTSSIPARQQESVVAHFRLQGFDSKSIAGKQSRHRKCPHRFQESDTCATPSTTLQTPRPRQYLSRSS